MIPTVGSHLDLINPHGKRIKCANCGNQPDYWKVATNSMEGKLGLYCPACGYFFARRYQSYKDIPGRYRLQGDDNTWVEVEVSSKPKEPIIVPRPHVGSHLMAESEIRCTNCMRLNKDWIVAGWQWRKDKMTGEIKLRCIDCDHIKHCLMRPCEKYEKDCVEVQIVDRWINFRAVKVISDLKLHDITIGVPTYTDKETHMHLKIHVVKVIDGYVGQILATFEDSGDSDIIWQSDPVNEDETDKEGRVVRTADRIARTTAEKKRTEVVRKWFK